MKHTTDVFGQHLCQQQCLSPLCCFTQHVRMMEMYTNNRQTKSVECSCSEYHFKHGVKMV